MGFPVPKNGLKYQVLGPCRISTDGQDALSLGDQEQQYRRHLDVLLGMGMYELIAIKSRGSGEWLDREELRQMEDLIESRKIDLVITEDLARISRRHHYILMFIEKCLDFDTHLIAINDHIDTRDDNWQMGAFFNGFRHMQYNADTAKRIRRSQINRFNQGMQIPCLIYGYKKSPGAKHENEIIKDPEAIPVWELIFSMLENGANYAQVTDKLNEMKIPTGPICRLPRWSGSMLGRLMFNPILKGQREHNKRITKRLNETGRHYTVRADAAVTIRRNVPHLAFIEPERYDRVIAMLKARNKHYSRNRNGHDPLLHRPKKRTAWPGQHCYCSICNRVFVYGKSKNKTFLDCSGSRE